MIETIIVLILIGLIVAGILLNPVLVKRRRHRLKQRSLSPLWQALLEQSLPMYARLSVDERRRLQGHLKVLLAEKQFIGCAGLQVTDEMKLTIAAIASLLLLNEQGNYFPNLRSILIYPRAYFVTATTTSGNYVVEEQRVARLGESWLRDQMVLAWEQVHYDTHHWQDGHNVVLHEFAHQLDQADGSAQGVPILPQASDYAIWAEVMTAEYQRFCADVERGVNTVMDSYGALNAAEFFAVATETFFERPQQLLRQHHALYNLLQRYYQVAPHQWV